MQKIKNKSIVFIQKDKLEYFDEIQSRIFQFVFQPTIIQDLEIVDASQLNTQLKSFIEINKLTVSNILFIVAEAIIFEKTFQVVPNVNKDLEIQKYLENIPFEHVSFKLIDGQKDYKVLAINKEFFAELKMVFESLGSKIVSVIPQSALAENYRNSQSFNSDMIKYILSHFDLLQKQGFIQTESNLPTPTLGEEEIIVEKQAQTPINQNPINKYRLPVLLSVFVVLIGVLSYFVYIQYTQKSKASPVPSTIVTPSIETPSPTIEESRPSSPSASPT